MRLVVVGHSYGKRFAQKKYVALKAVVPHLQLRLIVPTVEQHAFGTVALQRASGLGAQEVVGLPAHGRWSHMTYWFNPLRLAAILREFAPLHVHVEEDPHSCIGTEIATLAASAAPEATLSFFIWDNLARRPAFPAGVIKRMLTAYTLARAVLVVCGNMEAQRLLPAKGYAGRSAVLPQHGIDPEEYAVPPDPTIQQRFRGDEPGAVVVGYVGRFVREKGIVNLLEALARVDVPWRCVLVGRGPLEDDLRGRWQRELGERLLVLDPVPHEGVPALMRCFDVFVYNSKTTPVWKEQFGVSLVQAMTAGAACIGSSSGAIPEVLGDAGLIVPEDDDGALYDALRRLLGSASQRERFGSLARNRAMACYTHRVVAEQYARVFWGDASG